jgi:hypothetical protein
MLVMRKGIGLLAITAAATLLAPGSALRATRNRAVAHALVETWLGSGGPEDASYTVYLVRGGPLWFGHLPGDAILVGDLRIGHQVPDETEVGDTYSAATGWGQPEDLSGIDDKGGCTFLIRGQRSLVVDLEERGHWCI